MTGVGGRPVVRTGDVVRDLATGRVGVFMAVETPLEAEGPGRTSVPLAFLRPVGGGHEWTTQPDQLAPAGGHVAGTDA